MERKLPIAEIAGTSFYVDVKREELRQTDDAGNRISFNELAENKKGYSFVYDTRKKNVPDRHSEDDRERTIRVTLPALMELDPAGLAEKYGIPVEVFASAAQMPGKVQAIVEPIITRGK